MKDASDFPLAMLAIHPDNENLADVGTVVVSLNGYFQVVPIGFEMPALDLLLEPDTAFLERSPSPGY